MMAPRLKSGLWVDAYIRYLGLRDIPAFLIRRGDADAGTIYIKVNTLDGCATLWARQFDFNADTYIWSSVKTDTDAMIDDFLTRCAARDPDIWGVEIESRTGAHYLDALPL